ncbi:hypothetical protein [Paenibacillus thalictri]|uniref:Uncharacterized protein n=1 Tax=Paenibacillus thalictri TaxID=2527873 RepID=A0A4V2J4K1_9BACL|nr:hypothetical protein [Paenibacillus thalictri]TBL79772.1 hypothetical protein EYB31_09210 [Paenibacillus thalictri]
MKSNREQKKYARLFKLLSGKVEKTLIRIVIGLAAALLISQLLLQFDAVRSAVVKVEQLEGTFYKHP